MPVDLEALMASVIAEMEEGFGCLACINAVAALIDAGKELGERLEPLTVRAAIFNPRLSERLGDPSDPNYTESRLREMVREEGTAMVKLGMGEAPKGAWPGHLAAMMDNAEPKKKTVLDPTLHQVNQPAHRILLNPLMLAVPVARIKEGDNLYLRINGCAILYRFFPDDWSFENTRAWGDWRQRMFIRDRVLERMRRVVQ